MPLDPQHTAIVLIGFQNDYFAPDGALHDVIEAPSRLNRTVENTLALVERVASSEVLLVAAPILFTPTYRELDLPVGILDHIREVGAFQAGTEGAELLAELAALGSRLAQVPGRRGLNAFSDTNLDDWLRERGVENVVLAGAVTSICIDSTGRSAHERGYRVFILSDCTSARTNFEQEFYCEQIFPLYAEVLDHQSLLARLGLSPGQGSAVAATEEA